MVEEVGDEEVEKIGEEVEDELKCNRLKAIATLIYDLNWSSQTLDEKIEKKYGKAISELSLEELDKVIESLKEKTKKKAQPTLNNLGKASSSHRSDGAAIVVKMENEVEPESGIKFEDTEGDILICYSNGNVYEISKSAGVCSCDGYKTHGHCKHLEEADDQGYIDAERMVLPTEAVIEEEQYKILVEGKAIQIPVKTIERPIKNELKAAEMLKSILGDKPNKKDVIEEYQGIEEISSDVIISLAQYAGIRFSPAKREVEKAKINLGAVYKAAAGGDTKYDAIVELMPLTEVTIRCKITAVAAWKDRGGNLRIGSATKEEHMTPYDLKDISRRGANFIETKCESKSSKKAILNVLPITHDGLLSKIKVIYGWE